MTERLAQFGFVIYVGESFLTVAYDSVTYGIGTYGRVILAQALEELMYLLLCGLVFLAAYTLNVLMITVGYHRGLAHGAVALSPRLRRFVIRAGVWITGLDPKAWVVMHRRHHAFSDTAQDPHSPSNVGLLGIPLEQLRSYERTLVGLARGNKELEPFTAGLDFDISWFNRKRVWWVPYTVQVLIALAIGAVSGMWLLAAAYYLGMMSHPVQGGLVNAFGHAVGGRNFATHDDSRNNLSVALLVAGEGLQNNHHAHPRSAKFSYRAWEPDMGYLACRVMQRLGLLRIDAEHLIPEFEAQPRGSSLAG